MSLPAPDLREGSVATSLYVDLLPDPEPQTLCPAHIPGVA